MTETVDRATDHIPQKSEWYFDEGVPGVGNKPEYLDPKYKTLAEQAKAYKEVRKAMGALKGAPEEYDFGSHKEYIDSSNPKIQDFIKYAKENKFEQEAFSKIIETFVDYSKSKEPNLDEEIAKLGPQGAQKIETIKRWAENNFSQKALDAIGKFATNADAVEFLDELRQYQSHVDSQPPGNDAPAQDFKPLTRSDVENEMKQNYKQYTQDPVYRAKITKMFEQAIG